MSDAALKKIDGRLRHLVRAQLDAQSGVADGRPEIVAFGPRSEGGLFSVYIQFRGNPQVIRDAGFELHGIAGTTARVVLTADRLEALAAVDSVLKVHTAGRVRKHLDHSVPDIRADLAWNVPSPTATGPDMRGKGVVIGVIDSGIDAFHRAFRNADGTTRIEFLWDQVLEDPARHPTNFPMGIEFDWHAIDQALTAHPTGDLPPSLLDGDDTDKHGHGTNVAGIAAGNGADPERCGREFQYVGVAPEANLVIVKVGFGDDANGHPKRQDVLQALDYIFEKAGARACVVNMSFGGHRAPHNGFADEDRRLDALIAHHETLAQSPGVGTKTIVVAAGNDRIYDLHAYVEIAPNTPPQTIQVSVGNAAPFLGFFISYNGDALVECRIILPVHPGVVRQTPVVHATDEVTHNVANHSVHFTGIVPFPGDPGTGVAGDPDWHFDALITNAGGGPVESGTWSIELNNVSPANARCHLWVYAPDEDGAVFLPPANAPVSPQDINRARKRPPEWIASTLAVPATATRVITVAAYNAERNHEIGDRSSQGPRVDGHAKPEIAAPGIGIDAPKGNARRTCCLESECCVDRYSPFTGTSQAAPHIAGVIALMLAQNKRLTNAEIEQMLRFTARKMVDLPAGWPPMADFVGSGMVDALAAVVMANHSAGGTEPNPPDPPAPFIALEPQPAWEWDWRARVRAWSDRLGPQPAWQLFGALMSEHFDEVQRLVNENKRVAAVWRHNGGPALVRHLIAQPPEDLVPIPPIIQGYKPAELVSRLIKLFERFGSPALRSDTARYSAFAKALPGASIADLDRILSETGAA